MQGWTAGRQAVLVLQLIGPETSAQQAARKNGPTVADVEHRHEKSLDEAENALRSKSREGEAAGE